MLTLLDELDERLTLLPLFGVVLLLLLEDELLGVLTLLDELDERLTLLLLLGVVLLLLLEDELLGVLTLLDEPDERLTLLDEPLLLEDGLLGVPTSFDELDGRVTVPVALLPDVAGRVLVAGRVPLLFELVEVARVVPVAPVEGCQVSETRL